MNIKALLAVIFVFIGCCSNVVFLELLVKYDPGAGNLITFLQFLFISIEGFIFTSKFGTKKPSIGLKDYFVLVLMFFTSSVCNNYAFDFNIPMPLHMIFRAGSLIANMIMGIIILKKRYTLSKYISVVMVTVGIIICTVVSGTTIKDTSNPDLKKKNKQIIINNDGEESLDNDQIENDNYSVLFWWIIGITLLTVALFISARMGIYQEVLYGRYGKRPREALFYTHLLPMPGFLFLYNNIVEHMEIATASQSVNIPLLNFNIPIIWLYLIGNVLTQHVCISSVYVLTSECSSLTVTLVVTLRKFTSLIFSILYFKNPFTLYHWIGTILVFIGTIIFTELIQKIRNELQPSDKIKTKIS